MSLAGSFLVARPVLKDPNFNQTVVLILVHSDEGAFGVVVNRPLPVAGLPFPLFDGGPCPSPGVVILHGQPDWLDHPGEEEQASPREVAPGIFVGDESCLGRAGEAEPGEPVKCRVFRGYAGWGAGQLEQELAAGAWGVTAASGKVLFDTPNEEMWDLLLPPRIPQPSRN